MPKTQFRSNPSDKGTTHNGGGSVQAANTGLAGIYQPVDTGSQGGHHEGSGSEDPAVLAQFATNRINGGTGIARVQKSLEQAPVFSDENGAQFWNGGSLIQNLTLGELGRMRDGISPLPGQMLTAEVGPQIRGAYGGTSRVATAALKGPSLPGGGENFKFSSPGFKLSDAPDPDLGDMDGQIRDRMQSAHLQPRPMHRDHVQNGRYAILRA